jgi:FkbM family methyltransferase
MKLIFDIGMYVGDDTSYYLQKGYKVVAVEANPVLAERNNKAFKKAIDHGQLTIINKGIAETKGNFSFWVNLKNREWSSFYKELATKLDPNVKEIRVDTIRLSDLFDEYGIPYYLKIDVEGMDITCLKSITLKRKPKYVSCEAGDSELLDILLEKGYTKFKMINQASGYYPFSAMQELLYFPSLLMKVVWKIRKKVFPFTVPYGSSGPLPDEGKGKWKTFDEIKKDYKTYYRDNGTPINKLSWYDFHATY